MINDSFYSTHTEADFINLGLNVIMNWSDTNSLIKELEPL